MFQAFAIQLGVSYGLGVLNRAMAGRPPRPPKPRPDDVNFPLTKAGTPIPYVFGTIKIDTPVLVWADLFAAIAEPGYPGTFRYSASCLFVLGTPPRAPVGQFSAPFLRRIWIADKKIPMPGLSLTHGNSDDILVDLGQEGGGGWFRGVVEFFDGRPDQIITTYPSTDTTLMKRVDKAFAASILVDRSLVPGYRNQILLALLADKYTVGSDATFGEQAQFPSVAAEVTCTDNLTNDASAAMVLYDLICAEVYRLGYDPALVNLASFQVASGDEYGLVSGKIDATQPIEQVINALLEQLDGVLDLDPSTGIIELRLVRGGYELSELREMNEDNMLGRPRIGQTTWLANANYVEVEFNNRDKQYQPDVIPSKRLSNAVNQGYRHRPRTIRYPYCCLPALAAKLAARDAAVICRPLMTATAVLDRQFYDIRRGQALRMNRPDIGVVDKAFRVLDIDRGQLADDAIRVTLIEDVFDQAAGAINPDEGTVSGTDTLPVLHRFVDEAPRWLVNLAYTQGLIPNATSPRVLAAGREEANQDPATSYSLQSRLVGAPSYANDVIAQAWPTTARVATAYPYHIEPYDTTTGLVIEAVTGELATTFEPPGLLSPYSPGDTITPLSASAGSVAGGANLIQVNGELLAFESVTYLGGGQFRLNNVWRGLLDTAPDDHAAGDFIFFLDYPRVGTRAWVGGDLVETQPITVPVELGDFDPPTDLLAFSGASFAVQPRLNRPYRGADLNAKALELCRGTAGLPAVSGMSKTIADYDGSLILAWRQRDNTGGPIVRGDDATPYSLPSGTWRVSARKGSSPTVTLRSGIANAAISAEDILIGKVGHGAIDVRVDSVLPFNGGSSWQAGRVRVDAHRARNLLCNGFATESALAGWTIDANSTVTQQNGATGLGGEGYFEVTASAIDNHTATMTQVVDVTGYKPNGLRARVVWYTRNKNADADDYADVVITSGATTDTSANVIGPTTVWKRAEHSIIVPPGATSVTVQVRMHGVSNDASNAMVAGISLHLEQASDELITNGSFTFGTFTGWTNVVESFDVNTTDQYASDGSTLRCAQGGQFSTSEIKQEVAIPTGYETGDAVLEIARAGIQAGEVVLEVLDGGGSVIASATTGMEGMIVWTRRRLIVALPDGAATLRVRLIGTWDGFFIPNDVVFDDASLRIHKELDATFERALDFSTPAYQVAPRTWQEAYLAWPTLAIPAVWNGASTLPSVRLSKRNLAASAAWSDGSTPAPAKLVGHWQLDESSATSIDAYRIARAAAGAAVDVQVNGYGEFEKSDSFSVAVCFRVTERAMAAACGLVGRRDPTGVGWGLQLDAAGRAVAVVEGTSERTAIGTVDHRDGAPHWVLMTWNGSTLRVVDAVGSATNGSDPGEFSITSYPLRIGRDGASSETGGVDIARVLIWDGDVITPTDFLDTIHRIGTDPNGKIDRSTGWTSSQPVWVDGIDDVDGATLVRCATRHVPITHTAAGFGVSIGAAQTNLVLSTDYPSGSHCGPEANVTLEQGKIDPTGLARGVRTNSTVAGFGYRLTDMALGVVGGSVNVVVWLRTIAVEEAVTIRLLDSNDVETDLVIVTATQAWQRFEVTLAWSGATPTGHLKLSVDGSTGTFDLASVAHVGYGLPTAYIDANTSVGDRHGVVVETLPVRLNREGEIEATGLATDPVIGSYLASVDINTTGLANRRALAVSHDGGVDAILWDNSGTPTNVSDDHDWGSIGKTRARWNRFELPEAAGDQLGVGKDDETLSSSAVAFSLSTSVASTRIRIGGGDPNGSTSPHALLQRVVIRSREEKLP